MKQFLKNSSQTCWDHCYLESLSQFVCYVCCALYFVTAIHLLLILFGIHATNVSMLYAMLLIMLLILLLLRVRYVLAHIYGRLCMISVVRCNGVHIYSMVVGIFACQGGCTFASICRFTCQQDCSESCGMWMRWSLDIKFICLLLLAGFPWN